jgi:hypothetical protein
VGIKKVRQLNSIRLGNKPDLGGIGIKVPEQVPRFKAYFVSIGYIDYLLSKGIIIFMVNKPYGIIPIGLNGDNLDNFIRCNAFQPISRPNIL